MNFRTALNAFLEYCAVERRLSRHTLQAYELDLIDFQRWLPHDTLPGHVIEEHLKGYLSDMVSTRNLSPATVRRRLASLRSFFRRLSDHGLASDPFANWRLKLPKAKRLPRALAKSEVVALLRFFATSDDGRNVDRELHIALRLMVATGLRVGELCQLSVADLSPDCSVLHIHGKGSRDRMAYVVDPTLKKLLRRLVVRRHGAAGDRAPLLINQRGAALRSQSVRARLRRYARDAGVQRRVTPHMLRHTAATLLIESGVDIRFVQRLLGHSSIATTEIYTHVADETLRVILERANVLGSLRLSK